MTFCIIICYINIKQAINYMLHIYQDAHKIIEHFEKTEKMANTEYNNIWTDHV